MDIQIPKLPALPRLPAIAVSRRQALIAAGAAVAVIAAAFIGWTLFTEHAKEQQVATFANHIAASESDLSRVYEKISAHMRSVPKNPAPAGADASMRELAAIGDYGRAVTAYHRQVIGADTVPEAYTGAQSAYIRALDNLNRAFSLWSSAAAAYDIKEYTAATDTLKRADEAWREYAAAIADYELELRAAEAGETPPPA